MWQVSGRSDIRYGNHRATLEVDDLLVLYTDGLTEARDRSGQQFGKRRLLESLERVSEMDACDVPESIFLDVFSFTDGELEDDMAIVALRRIGEADDPSQERLALGAA
jgi:sigma-B regulation protein RsbU (phosphoserine phosphatase)